MTVVVDANLIVAQVVEVSWAGVARTRFRDWVDSGIVMAAPSLWQYETTSTLRKLTALGALTALEADEALSGVFSLGIETIDPSPEVQRSALAWAERLRSQVAHDACYLALAERLHAPFWTGDRRLARAARAAGAEWVHDVLAEGEDVAKQPGAPGG